MPREKRQQRNNLSHPEQIVEHAADGGHSRVEMVNKKQGLQNLDPTPTLADLLFASHSLFVGTYYYVCCLLYVSGFNFSREDVVDIQDSSQIWLTKPLVFVDFHCLVLPPGLLGGSGSVNRGSDVFLMVST